MPRRLGGVKSTIAYSRVVSNSQKCQWILKTVAFIAGKSENPADQKLYIHFFIDNLIANISLYALSWPKLNFGSFEIIFKL